MLPRLLRARALLRVRNISRVNLVQRRTLIAPPKLGQVLLERRPDRELPGSFTIPKLSGLRPNEMQRLITLACDGSVQFLCFSPFWSHAPLPYSITKNPQAPWLHQICMHYGRHPKHRSTWERIYISLIRCRGFGAR